MKKIILKNEVATLALGKQLGQQLQPGQLIFLLGELGSGKTTLVRGILQAMGYDDMVKSPTYTLVESYDIKGLCIYHFDLYRIEKGQELEIIGIRDYLTTEAICLIEWPQRAQSLLPNADIRCRLEVIDDHRCAYLEN